MEAENIARVCYEANRVVCEIAGDGLLPPWDSASPAAKKSMIAGVEAVFAKPLTMPAEQHERWLRYRLDDGWTWGPVKDEKLKQHPNLVPFATLPPSQQAKDVLFINIVRALMSAEMLNAAYERQQQSAQFRFPDRSPMTLADVPHNIDNLDEIRRMASAGEPLVDLSRFELMTREQFKNHAANVLNEAFVKEASNGQGNAKNVAADPAAQAAGDGTQAGGVQAAVEEVDGGIGSQSTAQLQGRASSPARR